MTPHTVIFMGDQLLLIVYFKISRFCRLEKMCSRLCEHEILNSFCYRNVFLICLSVGNFRQYGFGGN